MSKAKFEIGDPFMEGITSKKRGDRIDRLSGVAYREKEGKYTRMLSEEEVDLAKSELAESTIKLADLEEERKEIMDGFKIRKKEIELVKNEFLNQVKYRSINCEGRLFEIDDQELGLMYIFDENGICVEKRGLLPNERQGKIRMMNTPKEGTNE